jgi:uncharacterized protein YjbI with pentapeptide repeats
MGVRNMKELWRWLANKCEKFPPFFWILGAMLVGAGVVWSSRCLYLNSCFMILPLKNADWCHIVEKSPPWFLVSGLASLPLLFVTWLWRETHKRKGEKQKDKDLEQRNIDLQQKDKDLTQRQAEIKQKDKDLLQRQEEIDLAREGQVTGRYMKAIENMAVRLGAVYALERTMKDSPKDHWMVLETLAAFVRHRCPLPKEEESGGESYGKTTSEANVEDMSRASRFIKDKPDLDVQAALTAIGRRNMDNDPEDMEVDLSRTDIRGADLSSANLKKTNLSSANLEGADLSSANLEGAFLIDAHLEKADLSSSRLKSAYLTLSDLEKADLSFANLNGAELIFSCLEEADLERATLFKADLGGAVLSKARGLTEDQLRSAILNHETKLPPKFQHLVPDPPPEEVEI